MKSKIIILVIALAIQQIELAHLNKRAAVGPSWPTNRIAYAFSNGVDFNVEARAEVEHIMWQMQNLLKVNGASCIEFVPRDNEPDYILFIDNGDCSSSMGYSKGANRISLSQGCISTEVVMHELMHRLGFDHEHSRHDRDDYINVFYDNIIQTNQRKNDYNFKVNLKSASNDYQDSPYDFFSITHYNSNALQKRRNEPTLVSKIPALLTKNNQIEIERRLLSNIDILQLQSMYNCKKLKSPKIIKEIDDEDREHREKQSKRFELEAAFLDLDANLTRRYLNKTYETCGMNHFWPADYPLVESNHKHYEYICIAKKKNNERCFFSIECADDESVCMRPFFKKRGWCVNTGYDDLNKINQKINDGIFENGKLVKDKLVEAGKRVKQKWDNFDGKKFKEDIMDETIHIKDKVIETSKKVLINLEEAGKSIKDSFSRIFGK